ncbi:hypothetical protein [Caulobacter endophyticus]|uniref:Uncharacterized protein n=1 Tax=Caulobacter endophyticus TaxID=2172652 RepID=A0A2T9JJB6_9CAUL|nr:hypothetical protein [Caulobacter endophyticus]PVM83787.1 hypothetical protein DDF67_20155 [Caulobacter endophyticus]
MDPFKAVCAVLLLGPPGAWLALLAVQRLGARSTRTTLIAAAILLAAIVLAGRLGVGFRDPALNILAICAAYLAYALLAFAAPLAGQSPRLRRRPMVLAVGLLAAFTPMVLGYFLGSVGLLALAFTIGDAARAPELRRVRADGLTCEIRRWSGGPSQDGFSYALYLERTPLPLRLRTAHGPLSQAEVSRLYAGGSADSCGPGRRSPNGR